MKMRNFILSLAVLVLALPIAGNASEQQIIKVPTYIPVGDSWPPTETWINLGIGSIGGPESFETFKYTRDMGPLEPLIKQHLRAIADKFVVPPGAEGKDYEAVAKVDRRINRDSGTRPLANYGVTNEYKLTQDPSGRWIIPPEALEQKVFYMPYPYVTFAPGRVMVRNEYVWRYDDDYLQPAREEWPSGGSCPSQPGEIYLHQTLVIPWVKPTNVIEMVSGTTTLYFNSSRTVFATYDLKTGRLVAQSGVLVEDEVIPPVQLRISLLPTGGVKIFVTGPVYYSGLVAYSDDLVNWRFLGDGSDEGFALLDKTSQGGWGWIDPNPKPRRFYRGIMY